MRTPNSCSIFHASYRLADWTTIPPATDDVLNFPAIDHAAILLALNFISSKAIGPDAISILQLKDTPFLLPYLKKLFEASFDQSCVPSALKEVRIMPVPKCASPQTITDMRPIAVASCLLKIEEKIMAKHIYTFADDHQFFSDFQYGFRAGHGVESAILHLLKLIRHGFNCKLITLALFIDLRRAFECVPHDLILAELRRLGASDDLIRWFISFLSDRTFTVAGPNGLSSKRIFGSRGVPQGSGLASLLFLLVIDSLLRLLNRYCTTIAYADNLVLLVQGKLSDITDLLHRLQFCIILLENLTALHGSAINPAKCSFIIFHASQSAPNNLTGVEAIIQGFSLPQLPVVKYLGLYIQPNLGWSYHVSKVAQRVFATLRQLSWRKDILSKATRRTLVTSLAIPHVMLNASALTNMKVAQQQIMQNLINSCTRFVSKVPRFRPLSRVRSNLNIMSFFNIRKYRTLCALHKIIYGVQSQYLKDLVSQQVPSSQRLRDTLQLNSPAFNCDSYQKSFLIQGIRAWNKLPSPVRLIARHSTFKLAV